MSTKISTSTFAAFTYFGIEEGIRALAAEGFDAMDFGLDFFVTGGDLQKGSTTSVFSGELSEIKEYFAKLKKVADEADIETGQTHAPFPSYIFKHDDKNEFILDMLIKSIYATAALGSKYIVIHPAFNSDYYDRISPKDEMELNYNLYRKLIPALKETGVVCCLENMYIYATFQSKGIGAAFSMPYYVNTFIDRMNEEAGEELFAYCFDSGHALLVGSDPEYFIDAVGERIKVVHLHDIYNNYDDHTAPFLGIMPWNRVLRGLHDIGYKGTLNLETGYFVIKNGKESARASFNILGNAAKKLRTMFDSIEK